MSKIELKDITLDYTDQGNVYHALDGVTIFLWKKVNL